MKQELSSKQLVVKSSTIHGYGVFAGEAIASGEIIEECHTLFVKGEKPTDLINYFFTVDEKLALPLGRGVIYNHSDQPNADYIFDSEKSLMVFNALRDIQLGEEIFVNYGSSWFSSRKAAVRPISTKSQLQKLILPMMRFAVITGMLFMVLALIAKLPLV